MKNNPQHDKMTAEILERIRSGNLRMKPRFYFVLKAAVVLSLSVLILLISVLLASFISFDVRLNGHESLLGFGTQGTLVFLEIFPWGLALLNLLLIILLGWMVRRFRFGYRRPVFSLFGVLLCVGVAAGVLFDRETPFHDDRFDEAEAGELPFALEFIYESAHTRPPEEHGIYRGFVIDIREESIVITNDDEDHDEDDGTWEVSVPADFDLQSVQVGDRLYVAGEREGEVIEAYGIRKLDR